MLIKNGRVIDPESGFDGLADLLIENGKIKKIVKRVDGGADNTVPERVNGADEVLDASGMIIAPGLVDVHVHFRDPGLTHKEDIETGAAAAKAGGYTTVVCMANTNPAADNPDTIGYIIEKGKKTGIHVLAVAAVSKGLKGRELTDMDALKACGAAGFTDDGIPLMDEKLVKQAMEKARELNLPLSFHEEDPAFIINNGINKGVVSDQLGIGGSPALAEDSLVARDCMIALHTGAAVNIQHISSRNSVKMVALAKQLGADVWAEVTPHHFTLDETAVLKHGTLAKMNPPLRTAKDREALIEGLKSGAIDIIATDHAPHSREEKEKPLTAAPSGIIGLETALPLAVTNLVKEGHLTYVQLFEKMCLNPARLYRLDSGRIKEGSDADLVIFDDRESFTVGDFVSKSSNSPFTGETLYGRVRFTICGGKVVFEA
ncbi:dihydroorotase [[Clostridium] symbiosum]|uniref:dihydroorotase n=1 Tax=Clostridium symbiosum TaxID=1512 RepID=UPI00210DF6E6|nr:dihydroorotase [[Clostridium] symbiosum]MCQ4990802.1 dihydroorotase [[Clostridium] symbiosum]